MKRSGHKSSPSFGGSSTRKRNLYLAVSAFVVVIILLGVMSQMLLSAGTTGSNSEEQHQASLAERVAVRQRQLAERKRKLEEEKEKKHSAEAAVVGQENERLDQLLEDLAEKRQQQENAVSSPAVSNPLSLHGDPLLPGQCINDPDLNDPIVKAIETPRTNKDYLRVRKGGFGYPDFLFQCRERRFGNYLHFMDELSSDVEQSILEPSGRYYWCPSPASLSSSQQLRLDPEVVKHLNPLNTPAIPSLVEGVLTPNSFDSEDTAGEEGAAAGEIKSAKKIINKKFQEMAETDRSFETLIPLLKISQRRTKYFESMFKFHQNAIATPTPDTGIMWSAGHPFNEDALGSTLLLKLWNERFGSDAPDAVLDHEERLKRVIVVVTWLMNRPRELHNHILRMFEKKERHIPDISVNDYWQSVLNFQLGALNITGRYRDETFFNNEIATKHCQLDSHDNEQNAPNGRKFRVHRLENLLNVRHANGAAWDFCDILTVDIFLRLVGISIASTQDMEALMVFNARAAMGTKSESPLEYRPDMPNAPLQSTLVKVVPGSFAEDFDPKPIENEDSCIVNGDRTKLGDFGIVKSAVGVDIPKLVMPPTICRVRHLARVFRKYHRLALRMGAVAATDRAAAEGLSKLLKEEGAKFPTSASLDPSAAESCPREETIVFEWLHSLSRMDETLKNIVPELQLQGVYDADAAEAKSTAPIAAHTAPLMQNPMTELWTQKIDDSFVPLWSLALWEQQQYELMSGPFAASGLLHIDRRYRHDSLSYNAHPFTIATKKRTIINSRLHEKFIVEPMEESQSESNTDNSNDDGNDSSSSLMNVAASGEQIAPFAARQFALAPQPDPALMGTLFNKNLQPFGFDQKDRTALAKISFLRYGFVDLDELVEATEVIEARGGAGSTSSGSAAGDAALPETLSDVHQYLSASNALSTIARILQYYTSKPFAISDPQKSPFASNPHCAPFVLNAETNTYMGGGTKFPILTKDKLFAAIMGCPAHPIHSEGFFDGKYLIYLIHRHPLGTYALHPTVRIPLGTLTFSGVSGIVSDGYSGGSSTNSTRSGSGGDTESTKTIEVGSVQGLKRAAAPPGVIVNDANGDSIPNSILQSFVHTSVTPTASPAGVVGGGGLVYSYASTRMPPQIDIQSSLFYTRQMHVEKGEGDANTSSSSSSSSTQNGGGDNKEGNNGNSVDNNNSGNNKKKASMNLSRKQFKRLIRNLRRNSWDFSQKFHSDLYHTLKHGEPIGLTERWPSYFAIVPIRWDMVFVPQNLQLHLSSAAIYTAAAIIRRPMMWVGSESNSLLARCVASNDAHCNANVAEERLAHTEAFYGPNSFTTQPTASSSAASSSSTNDNQFGQKSTLRYIPSFELGAFASASSSDPTFLSLTDAFHQRFPPMIVSDMFWMSMSTGFRHMKSSLRRHGMRDDGELQPPFTSCVGLRDAHPFVQYALSISYGEATITAVSEDHFGGLTMAQIMSNRPLQSHLAPSFMLLNGDDIHHDDEAVAGRMYTFAKIRDGMWGSGNAW